MGTTFLRKATRNVGTVEAIVGNYTVGASATATVIGLTVANTAATTVTVSVWIDDGANDTYLVKNAEIAAGSTLIVVGGKQKMVLVTGDSVRVQSNTATSVDANMSLLEMT